MSSKRAVWLAFFLNLSFAIVEFIAGGIFGSSAVLADSVHDLGDAIAIGIRSHGPQRCAILPGTRREERIGSNG